MQDSSIEWTKKTTNPIKAMNILTGRVGHVCVKVSDGCTNCYSSDMPEFRFGTFPFLAENREKVAPFLVGKGLDAIRRYRKPTMLLGRDMSAILCEWGRDEWLEACFEVM